MKENDIIHLDIVDNGMEGEGIARAEGLTVFVKRAIAGERVRAKIKHVKRGVAFAIPLDIETPSPARVKPACPVFVKCGGCDMLHIDYPMQLKIKEESIKNTIRKTVGDTVEVLPVVPSPKPFAYRNKVALPFGHMAGKGVVVGFYAEGTHDLVVIRNECVLHGDWLNKAIGCVLEYVNTLGLSVFCERTGNGFLRHMVARYFPSQNPKLATPATDGALCLTLVINGDKLPKSEELVRRLTSQFKDFSLYISPNKSDRTGAILGETAKLIYGTEPVTDILGIKVSVNPLSFLQVNDGVRDLICKAILAEIPAGGTVIDAYGGVGILSAMLAKRGDKVYNVEIVPEAIGDANMLCRLNGVKVNNICADATVEVPKILDTEAKTEKSGKLTVVLDPPRKGCEESLLRAISKTKAKIIYISCNPATLARDLKILTESSADDGSKNGRKVTVTPFDMFPQTKHVECLAIIM